MLHYIATALLFDKNDRLLIYLRDDKPGISFPGYWDLFGGMVEADETPEQALVREIEEELGIVIRIYTKFGEYDSLTVEARPNRKYVYYAKIDLLPEQLTLNEGQRLTSITMEERHNYKFANILGNIIDDYVRSKAKLP